MKKNKWIYAILIAGALGWSACDDDDDNPIDEPELNTTDKTFVEFAAQGNMSEVEFGKLAATKGTNAAVKAFGEQMSSEHSTAQDELEDIADDFDNVDWPESLNDEHDSIMAELNEAPAGYTFDTLYMKTQIMMHEVTAQKFSTATTNTTNARVKAYASKYHPAIEMHLQKADSIQNAIITANASGGTDANADSGGTTDGTDGTGDDGNGTESTSDGTN